MIKIKNIYYMLSYAFSILKESGYSKLQTEEFENAEDLLTAILTKGIANLIKRGIGKEYVQTSDSLTSPKGKISISESIKRNSIFQKKLVCHFDEFCEDIYINQILKSVSFLLLRSNSLDKNRKNELKKLMIFFDNVSDINPYNIKWSNIKYDRNNKNYQLLINICNLIVNGLILNEEKGEKKLSTFLDDRKMHSLYEKFVLEYYRKHYPELKPSPLYIEWNVDNGIVEYLPAMKTDITLSYDDKILIIDTKYYRKTMQSNKYYNSVTIHSNNLYQIFSYVKNKDKDNSGKVSGMLLYAKTDEEITPDNTYNIGGNNISVKTLDLNCDFPMITEQLNAIAENLKSYNLVNRIDTIGV